ncbi:MAG: DUF6691 family protein [Cohaesibacteraceae bacterium]
MSGLIRLITLYAIGLLFGIGIMLSGMANPAKVLNFFDVAGTWDPSLIFVMGGALITTLIGYRFVLPRSESAATPFFDTRFHLPTNRSIDAKLVGGSAVFGVGWGLAGGCPGGALPARGTGVPAGYIFTAALIAGRLVARFLAHRPFMRQPSGRAA